MRTTAATVRRQPRNADTRQRLLDAGLAVFAAEGFRKATIQEISRRAGANIAAVSYYFGDKAGLYAAVFESAERQANDEDPWPLAGDGPPEQRLHAHIAGFLARLLDRDRRAVLAQLLAREMVEPTPALDRLVRRRMRSNHDHVATIIRELLGADADAETVRLCTLSVVAQCVFYRNSAPIVARLYPDLDPPAHLTQLADHITAFSLAAIRAQRAERAT
ncbi:MAG: CerR family C-terminal domain-containing protein [bacterium]